MGKIIILDEHTANKIAAGEVVERPASVVKELCENSIDAGATSITVEIKNGGISYIKVIDNGSGIAKDDVEIAFEKHSTSKIKSAEDLQAITSMGFRGEALSSIAAVSRIELITKTVQDIEGSKITVEGGKIGRREDIGCPVGTSILVKDLFFNTPARYKFLKSDRTEAGYVEDVITRLALGHPYISFKFINSGSLIIQTPGNNDLLACGYSIFGNEVKATLPINYEEDGIKVTGLAGKPEIARANRSRQIFFINKRFVKDKIITSAVEEAYKTLLQTGKYPFVILNIEINPRLVDVNVHPTKQEVRFSNENQVFGIVYHSLKNALFCGTNLVPEFQDTLKGKSTFRLNGGLAEKDLEESNHQRLVDIPKSNQTSILKKFGLESNSYGNNYYKKEYKVETEPFTSLLPDIIQKDQCDYTTNEIHESIKDEYIPFRVIGTVFSTYIIVELSDELYLIDQHAAHERVMYEKLVKEWEGGNRLAQALLIPEIIELTHKEIKLIEENKERLINIGFDVENFGNNAVKINTVPFICDKINPKDLFLEVVDGLEEVTKTRGMKMEEHLLHKIACKAAVKANMRLSDEEIWGLINSISELENPYTCPHGRPTVVKITKQEIERRFGR